MKKAIAIIGMLMALFGAAGAGAQTPAGSAPAPELHSPRQFQRDLFRLPPVADSAAPIDDRDVVLFAAGAVELRPPLEWQVREAPLGREVRLAISPAPPRGPQGLPLDGMWLVFHPHDSRDLSAEARLAARGRQLASQGAQLAPPERIEIAGFAAVRQQFSLPAEGAPAGRGLARRGLHLAIDGDGGVCEIHAAAPLENYAEREVQFAQVLASLTLHAPRPRQHEATDATRAAAAIFGSWKAYRSRLRLHGDGRIAILTDPPVNRAIGASSSPHNASRPAPITGRYTARDDLLLIEWDDGSKLNFRWRLADDRLLVTDHEGQISQLKRLLE